MADGIFGSSNEDSSFQGKSNLVVSDIKDNQSLYQNASGPVQHMANTEMLLTGYHPFDPQQSDNSGWLGDALTKGVALSVASGAYSLYNSTLGLVTGQADLGKDVQNYDAAWGNYYQQNQGAIDLTGDILGLAVPGTMTMKFLKAAKSADTALGAMKYVKTLGNLDRAAAYWKKEAVVAGLNQATADASISAYWKAQAFGAAGAIQDSAVLTAASWAFMNKSQMYDDYSVSKFASDTLFGSVLFGLPSAIKTHFGINADINTEVSKINALNYVQGNAAGTPDWVRLHGLLQDGEEAASDGVKTQAKNQFLKGVNDLLLAPDAQALKPNLQGFMDKMDSGTFWRDFAGVKSIGIANPNEMDLSTGAGIKKFLSDRNVLESLGAGPKDKTNTSVFTILEGPRVGIGKAELAGQQVFQSQVDAEKEIAARLKENPTQNLQAFKVDVRSKHLFNTTLEEANPDLQAPTTLLYAPTNASFEKANLYGMKANELAQAIKNGTYKAATPSYYVNLLTGKNVEAITQTAGDKGIMIPNGQGFYLDNEFHSYNAFEDHFADADPAVSDGMFLTAMKRMENPGQFWKTTKEQQEAFAAAGNTNREASKWAIPTNDLLGLQAAVARKDLQVIPVLENGVMKEWAPQQAVNKIHELKANLLEEGQKQGLSTDDLSVRLNMDAEEFLTGNRSKGILYNNAENANAYASPTNAKVSLETGDFPTREDYLGSMDRKMLQEAARVQSIGILSPVMDDLISHANFIDNGYSAKDFVPKTGFASTLTFGGKGKPLDASSYFERIGALGQEAKMKYGDKNLQALTPAIAAVQKSPEARFEFNNFVNLARSLPAEYRVVSVLGADGKSVFGKIQNIKTGDFIQAKNGANDLLISPTVMKLHQAFEAINDDFITRHNAIREAQGDAYRLERGVLYYPPVDVRNRDLFAFVRGKDGQLSAITAANAKDLTAQAEAIKAHFGNSVDIIYKQDIKDFKQRFGEFDSTQYFKSHGLDSAIRRSGALSTLVPSTDDTTLQELMGYVRNQSSNIINDTISTYMAREFEELNFLSDSYNKAAASGRGFMNIFSKRVGNPYQDYIATALNKSNLQTSPILESMNNSFNLMISKMFNEIKTATSLVSDKPLEVDQGLRQIQNRYGVKFDYTNPEMLKTINANYDKNMASSLVSRFNGLLAKLTLPFDGMFHMVNALSAPLMLSPEIANLRKNLTSPETIAKLKELTGVNIPGTQEQLPTAMKMMKNSIAKLLNKDDTTLADYVNRGLIDADVLRYRETQMQLADMMSVPPSTLIGKYGKNANGLLNDATNFVNRWATEPTYKLIQYAAIDATHQMMDAMGVEDNKIKDVVANMIAKRANGNYISGQRPVIFQGPLGHALGLFQTFMFTMGQNLTRYIAEGDKAALATFGLMQTGLFGAQSNPVFQLLNTHIGHENADRKDLFTAAYSYGKLGDWLLYGIPSNVLNLNLYSRGDLMPRNATIIPTSPSDIPIVAAGMKIGKNIANVVDTIRKGGGDGDTFLRAVSLNGINRPLAGIAQLVDGRSIDQTGSTINSQIRDWTAWTRVVGGRPFDEQKMLDGWYRQKAYEAYDVTNLKNLGTAIKGTVAGGGEPTDEQMKDFLASYIGSGGNARNFQRYWTQQVINANTSLGDRLYNKMASSPKFNEWRQILGATSIRNPNGTFFGDQLNADQGAGINDVPAVQ